MRKNHRLLRKQKREARRDRERQKVIIEMIKVERGVMTTELQGIIYHDHLSAVWRLYVSDTHSTLTVRPPGWSTWMRHDAPRFTKQDYEDRTLIQWIAENAQEIIEVCNQWKTA